MPPVQYRSQVMDHLGLAAVMCKELGIAEHIIIVMMNSARSEDGRKLRIKIRFCEENSELFDE